MLTNGIGVVDVVVGAVGSTPATSEMKYSEKVFKKVKQCRRGGMKGDQGREQGGKGRACRANKEFYS